MVFTSVSYLQLDADITVTYDFPTSHYESEHKWNKWNDNMRERGLFCPFNDVAQTTAFEVIEPVSL